MTTVTDRIARLLEVELELAALEARKRELRAELYALALDRLATDGAAPAWKAKGLGAVTLVCPDPSIEVLDDETVAEWVAGHAPTEVTRSVRRSYLDALKARLVPVDGVAVIDPETGERVPGMGPRVRDPYLSVRLDRAAKAAAQEAAE